MKILLVIVLFSIIPQVVFPQTPCSQVWQPAKRSIFSPHSGSMGMFGQKPLFMGYGNTKTHIIPLDFHTRHFGFFCRQELRMHQAHVPVTFRLGSMEQCNQLEGKAGYR